jgi:hypothetical protein
MTGLGGLVSLNDVPQWALPQERGDLRVIDLTLLERSAALADEPLGVPAAAGR